MSRHSFVIVSNRLPVSVSRDGDKLVYSESSGGLATAMSSLEHKDKIWVGWPGITSDDLSASEKKEITTELAKRGCHPVFLSADDVALFYEGYSNDTLWPLFHYFQSVAQYDDEYWHAYERVNEQFAKISSQVATKEAKIWIQDYQLMLMPKLLRARTPAATIGFFLHIPFPSFEIYRLLPERTEILEGLLGSDVIGFHIYDYSRHFLSSCKRLLGISSRDGVIDYDGRRILTGMYPISIDYEKFQKQLSSKETKKALVGLNETYRLQKLIISVDRLDYSKGILKRLEGFRLLLETHPEYRGQVKLLMIAVPSRTGVEAYKQLRDEIEQTVSRINGEFGSVDWAPISYQFQNRPFSEIVALYSRADIALVTPIRDGMNLVAKEYVASKKKKAGVLILSEMTGAADELSEALIINPNDIRSIAGAIRDALEMPRREQLRRLKVTKERLKEGTVQRWGADFMRDLENVPKQQDRLSRKNITPAQQKTLLLNAKTAASKLYILDYDGTLKKHTNTPNPLAAAPSLRVRRILKALTDQPNTKVAIVSGRPKRALTRWLRGLNIIMAAEHGAWTHYDGSWQHTDFNFKKHKKKIRAILEDFLDKTAGAEIEEKDFSIVWHYVNVAPELAFTRAAEIRRTLAHELDDDIGVYSGNNIIEIKPRAVSKAHVVRDLKDKFPAEFIFCAGDDYTDEDMFEELENQAETIKVGPGETRAKYQIESVGALVSLLEQQVRIPESLASRIKKLRG